MTYAICTSFSKEGYEEYGKDFLISFERHWPKEVPLFVYTEDEVPRHGVACWQNLETDQDLTAFLKTCPEDSKDYRWMVRKFAHKVFALTDPDRPDVDWWIWLDADVVTTKPITDEFLAEACPMGFLASYLGRKDWHTSECGWVAYSKLWRAGDFLKRFREVYTSGEIFDHLEWHDSYIFDRVREEFEGPGLLFKNLSEGVPGMHVWDGSILGTCMEHKKGPLRKKGVRPEGISEDYWSEHEQIHAANPDH